MDQPKTGGAAGTMRREDLTQGSIPGHMVKFAIPLLIGNVFQALYNTVDSIWVGRFVGKEALGAISAAFPVMFFLVAMFIGVGMASTVLVSQFSGARQEQMVKKSIVNSLVFAAFATVLMMVLGTLLSRPLLNLLRVPDEILPMSADYLRIFFLGIVFMAGYNTIAAILRGLGDSRTPVLFLIVAVTINIILDPIFIIGLGPVPAMGVKGAALATVLSQGVAFFLSIRYLARKGDFLRMSLKDLIPDGYLMRKLLVIGVPAGLQQTVVSMAIMVLSSIVNSFGTTVVAAFGAASRLDQFALMPTMSVGLSTAAIAGQNIGAGRQDRVRSLIRWSCLIAASIASVITLVALFLPRVLISLFTADEGVLAVGEQYLRIVGLGYIPFSMMFIFNSLFKGAGDTIAGMVISGLNLWVIRVPLAGWLSGMESLQSRGIWIAISASNFTGLTVSWLYYASGLWKRKRVVQEEAERVPSETHAAVRAEGE